MIKFLFIAIIFTFFFSIKSYSMMNEKQVLMEYNIELLKKIFKNEKGKFVGDVFIEKFSIDKGQKLMEIWGEQSDLTLDDLLHSEWNTKIISLNFDIFQKNIIHIFTKTISDDYTSHSQGAIINYSKALIKSNNEIDLLERDIFLGIFGTYGDFSGTIENIQLGFKKIGFAVYDFWGGQGNVVESVQVFEFQKSDFVCLLSVSVQTQEPKDCVGCNELNEFVQESEFTIFQDDVRLHSGYYDLIMPLKIHPNTYVIRFSYNIGLYITKVPERNLHNLGFIKINNKDIQ